MKALNCLATLLFAPLIIVCLIASFKLISPQSTITLLVFNALFISILFLLNGSYNRKLCLLALGNAIGLCWNFILNSLAIEGIFYFGKTFLTIYAVFFPFLSSAWMISFWSISLSILHRESAYREMKL